MADDMGKEYLSPERDRRREEILYQHSPRARIQAELRRKAQEESLEANIRKAERKGDLFAIERLYEEYPRLADFVPKLTEYISANPDSQNKVNRVQTFFEEALKQRQQGEVSFEFVGATSPDILFKDYPVAPTYAASARLIGEIVGVRLVNNFTTDEVIELDEQASQETQKVLKELGLDQKSFDGLDKSAQQQTLDNVASVHNLLHGLQSGAISYEADIDLTQEEAPQQAPPPEPIRKI